VKRLLALAVLIAASGLGVVRAADPAASPHGSVAAAARVGVRLLDGVDLHVLLADSALAGRTGVEVEAVTRAPLRAILRPRSGSASDAFALAADLSRSGRVDYAVPELFWPMELRSRYTPDDPLFPEQWPLENVGQAGARALDAGAGAGDVDAAEAWSYTLGSPDVLIAVLDDGVQLDHPDLAANVADVGRDFTVDPPRAGAEPKDADDRHGTAAAGVAAAVGGNGIGVSGMCPRCRILPIRIHGSSNLGIAAAFRYAMEQGADIVTNSWGYARSAPAAADAAVRDAIDTAAREGRAGRGALIVFGMTNERVDNCSGEHLDISSLESVVAVGVADHDDVLGGSGFGPCMDLVAPAKPKSRSTIGVTTTDRTGLAGHAAGEYYASFGGTSAAAPLVAGIAGLLLSLNPDLGRDDLQRILEHTADKIDPLTARYDAAGFSMRAGYGRVNAASALVPSVTVAVTPQHVRAGEPFSVTVTASAPLGLDSVWWSAPGARGSFASPQRRSLDGEFVASLTWPNLTIDSPGTFAFLADARDVRYAEPRTGYPHRATERAPPPAAYLTVFERSDAGSR
jgi:subtilisin family serine protease